MKNKMKRKIGQALLFIIFNLSWSALMVFGFMQMTVYR